MDKNICTKFLVKWHLPHFWSTLHFMDRKIELWSLVGWNNLSCFAFSFHTSATSTIIWHMWVTTNQCKARNTPFPSLLGSLTALIDTGADMDTMFDLLDGTFAKEDVRYITSVMHSWMHLCVSLHPMCALLALLLIVPCSHLIWTHTHCHHLHWALHKVWGVVPQDLLQQPSFCRQ